MNRNMRDMDKYMGNMGDFMEKVISHMKEVYNVIMGFVLIQLPQVMSDGSRRKYTMYEIWAEYKGRGRNKKIEDSHRFEDDIFDFCNYIIKSFNLKPIE